jgi:signal transduction histidine kinase
MDAFAETPRHWVVDRLGLEQLGARLVRPVTRDPAATATQSEIDGHALATDARLRIATVIALVTGVLFLPLEARRGQADVLFPLLVLYGVHTLLSGALLLVSQTALGARNADRLAVVLVAGHVVNLHVYLYLWPAHPELVAGILTCLLVGSTVLFSWSTRRTLVLSVAACLAFVIVGRVALSPGPDRAPFTVVALVPVVGAATAVGVARLLAMLRASLARREIELGALSSRLMSAQEEERRRLARELHDEFGQSLTAVNTYLWLIEREAAALDTVRTQTAEARRVVTQTLGAMRELSQLLRPSVLDDFGLVPSLESHLDTFAKRHEIATSLSADGLPERLPPEIETALYRIAQEALTNVARHARATRVRLALAQVKDEVRLEIEDDGVGLPAGPRRYGAAGTGLIGMRERARALGGGIEIRSGRGTCIRVSVPLPR